MPLIPILLGAAALSAVFGTGGYFLKNASDTTKSTVDLGKVAIGAGAVYIAYKATKSGALK